MSMKVKIKGNSLEFSTRISPEDFERLVHLHKLGDISVSISVYYGERVGFLPLNDLDLGDSNDQLSLEL